MTGKRTFLAGFASGVTCGLLFDGGRGRMRRQHLAGSVRHERRRVVRGARGKTLRIVGRGKGVAHRLRPFPVREPLDDVELAHKVESILFRDPRIPKGAISINAESGAIYLRGQVEDAALTAVVTESVRHVPGVTRVVNLLHLPGTPAPHAS